MSLNIGNQPLTWKDWWNQLSWARKLMPALTMAVYWSALAWKGTLTADHEFAGSFILLLYYGGPATRPLFQFLLPLFLMMVIYDSQRYWGDLVRGPVHVREPFEFDKRFFGIEYQGQRLTPCQWFQIHTHPVLDFIAGFLYITFVPIFLLFAAYFQFYLGNTGTGHMTAEQVTYQSKQILWAFFWVNIIGFSTYYWYAASPPWYADMYGFGPARLDIGGNPAGCVRFDKLLGTHIFDKFYGRAADVHGAIPSLHVAYPFQAVLFSFKFRRARIPAILFYLGMCFSAVYLNHHYVLDVMTGTLYALMTTAVVSWVWNWRARSRGDISYLTIQTVG